MTDLRTTIAEVLGLDHEPRQGVTHCSNCLGFNAILTAVERYVVEAELKVWHYIAMTPVFEVPIRNLDAEESYTYHEPHYIPPKKFVDEMVAELIAKLNKEKQDDQTV